MGWFEASGSNHAIGNTRPFSLSCLDEPSSNILCFDNWMKVSGKVTISYEDKGSFVSQKSCLLSIDIIEGATFCVLQFTLAIDESCMIWNANLSFMFSVQNSMCESRNVIVFLIKIVGFVRLSQWNSLRY